MLAGIFIDIIFLHIGTYIWSPLEQNIVSPTSSLEEKNFREKKLNVTRFGSYSLWDISINPFLYVVVNNKVAMFDTSAFTNHVYFDKCIIIVVVIIIIIISY